MAAQPSSARNITVVIPSYPPHVFHLEAQLETWVRYCSDAGIVSFDVITRARDVKAFVQVLAWLLPYLPRLRVRSLEDLIESTQSVHMMFTYPLHLFEFTLQSNHVRIEKKKQAEPRQRENQDRVRTPPSLTPSCGGPSARRDRPAAPGCPARAACLALEAGRPIVPAGQ